MTVLADHLQHWGEPAKLVVLCMALTEQMDRTVKDLRNLSAGPLSHHENPENPDHNAGASEGQPDLPGARLSTPAQHPICHTHWLSAGHGISCA